MTTEIQINAGDIRTLNTALNDLARMLNWEKEVLDHWTAMHQIAYDDADRAVSQQTSAMPSHLEAAQVLVAEWSHEIDLATASQPEMEGHDYDN